jgi:hypothetical protein
MTSGETDFLTSGEAETKCTGALLLTEQMVSLLIPWGIRTGKLTFNESLMISSKKLPQ